MHLLRSPSASGPSAAARAQRAAARSSPQSLLRRPTLHLARHSTTRGVPSTIAIPDLPEHLKQELDELEDSAHCGTEGESCC